MTEHTQQRVTRVIDQQGSHDYHSEHYPLSIGGPGCTVQITDANELLARIELQQGHPKLFNQSKSPCLWHNHQLVKQAVWLKSGDHLQFQDKLLAWEVHGDLTQLSMSQIEATQPLTLTPENIPNPVHRRDYANPETVVINQQNTSKRFRLGWILSAFILLLAMTLLVLVARPITVNIEPEPELLLFEGRFPLLNLGMVRLGLPGDYQLIAKKQGYHLLVETFAIHADENPHLQYVLKKLPGLLTITTQPVNAQVSIDDQILGKTPLENIKLETGTHQIQLQAPRFQSIKQAVQITGMEQLQQLAITLTADWATITINSDPAQAEIKEADNIIGTTPAEIPLPTGKHQLSISKAGYQTTPLEVDVVAEIRQTLPIVQLQKIKPAKAQKKPRPAAQKGTVFISTQPADAVLWVDGKRQKNASTRLTLSTAKKHAVEVRKPGYQSYQTQLTADTKKPQTLTINLIKSAVAIEPYKNSAAGQRLVRIAASPVFMMGASRREPGRRSNENLRQVQLTRAFYFAKTEVSNAQFRQFKPAHDSGSFAGLKLNGDRQPVVNISWTEAAQYANWLSDQEGLLPAYHENNGVMHLRHPLSNGYRLPSEAEWEYVARYARRQQAARFPWPGNVFPPALLAGNYADSSAQDYLPQVITRYSDGFPVSAPVRSFQTNPLGIYNLGGNVSEWVHDYYAIYPGSSSSLKKDPLGPEQGRHRVVKGASWKDASITELRFSYRNYSDKPRNDLGFRVVRFTP